MIYMHIVSGLISSQVEASRTTFYCKDFNSRLEKAITKIDVLLKVSINVEKMLYRQ